MTNVLKDELFSLKSKLENIEIELEAQMIGLESREEKWKKMDERVCNLKNTENNQTVTFNVGGKIFSTKMDTILSVKDTLLYKLITSDKFNLKKEIFFDRSPKMFYHILDFLRFKKINYKRFNKEELNELKIETEYYEIAEIYGYLHDQLKEIEFVRFESNGVYEYNNQTAGTNLVKDLNDRSLLKGICAKSPGWIVIELNSEWEFEELDIAGWNGNSSLWYNGNGSGASILTSIDKINWKSVGTIPSNYAGTIQTVKLAKSTGRYIKFNHSSYLGIGYLNIKKKHK